MPLDSKTFGMQISGRQGFSYRINVTAYDNRGLHDSKIVTFDI